MLRVLVVLPFYGGSLPIGRFAAEGLKEAGCLVDVFEAPEFFSSYTALQALRISPKDLDSLQNSYLQFVSQAVLAKAEAFSADLVLCMAQAPLNRLALRRLKKAGIASAMWFVEDHRLFTYWRTFAPHYDFFAVIQKDPFLQELAASGVENALYLPLAALPSFHKPQNLRPEEQREFGAELSFMGAGYPNRRKAFLQLLDTGLKIWGTEWDQEPGLAHVVQHQGRRISPEDAVRIFNAATINLNLHSSVRFDEFVSRGDFVNPRTFEVAACGAFQLVDERSLLPELFGQDEMVTFSDMDDLKEKIHHFAARPEERAAYAARARSRVLAEHTYAARMKTLLDFVRSRRPGFGERERAAWPENMPPDMREQAAALMLELQLPEEAGFDDLIAAVRQKPDRLNDTEAALLFLDEWKKIYQ